MNGQLLLVLALLLVAIVMFAINRPRMDVVALLVIVVLPLTGILTVPQTLEGFADPNVILVGVMFVVGEGLSRTGVSYRLGDWIVKRAGASTTRLLVLLMLGVATLGAFMSSTGVVAIFIPVVLSVATRLKISPRLLMMPLSFAALISGTLTLIATAPNLVVNAELVSHGHAGFGFFQFTPFGLAILVVGVGYMLVARRWLDDGTAAPGPASRRGYSRLIVDYRLAGRERRLKVRRDSPLVGSRSFRIASREPGFEANLIAIERKRLFHRSLITDVESTSVERGDVLLVDIVTGVDDLRRQLKGLGLDVQPLGEGFFAENSRQLGLAEVMVPPNSPAIGRPVHELRLHARHGVEAIGLRRTGTPSAAPSRERVRAGDTLLIAGGWGAVRSLQSHPRDYVFLDLPPEIDEIAPAANRAPFALLSLVIMVVLMATGIVPNVIAALLACLLMWATGCLDLGSAYRAIQWPPLILIVGMLPFATALEKTGGVELAANGLLHVLQGAGPYILLGGLFVITAVIGMFVSNTATAVLMTPVALAMASSLHASPYPFAMIVALASSAAFMTPMSSPVNTLVIEPGRYRLGDFIRVGAPFTVIVLVISVLLVPLILPL